ncbi:MAG: hypothetical protein DMF56_00375 [Acidobacteria bacterium]|nr:MAG: hypothetical protein DMF56_00375 [Acidobacteriota bacterium]
MVLILMFLFAASALAQPSSIVQQTPFVQQVSDDALVVDRVAQASKRDLPRDLLKRIVNEDVDLLRGKRPDGSFQYATYERFEAARATQSFSVQPRKDQMETDEVKGSFIYRVVLEVPTRRLLVRKNLPVWIERVDIEMVAEGKSQTERSSVDVKAWMQPGDVKPIDLPAVARQVKIGIVANGDPKGYGNLDVVLVQARIVDNADSPYAQAVASAKAMQRALDNGDIPSLRASAQRVRDVLGAPVRQVAAAPSPSPSQSTMTVTAAPDAAAQVEMQTELQLIEDLLTGSEAERREGLDQLHQLIRKMRR